MSLAYSIGINPDPQRSWKATGFNNRGFIQRRQLYRNIMGLNHDWIINMSLIWTYLYSEIYK